MRKRELGCRRECFVCVAERDGEGVVTVKWMFQHTDEQDEGAEGKSQPEVLLEVGKCKCLYIDSEKSFLSRNCQEAKISVSTI